MPSATMRPADGPAAKKALTTRARLVRMRVVAGTLFFRWLTPAALILGVLLRTREWLHDKSLWLDEISISLYLTQRDYRGLLRPLGDQGGPVGWLWAERTAIDVFGVSELSLRLVPWVASLVALAVFPVVAKRLAGPVATPVATVLFATAPAFIYYAAETKQYSSDTACALLALLVTTALATRPVKFSSSLRWGLACGALAWFSQPTILVVAACALWVIAYRARDRAALLPILAGCAALGLMLGAEWFVSLRQLAANEGLAQYWQGFGGYPPASAGLVGDLGWLGRTTDDFVRQIGHFAAPGLFVALALWGLATMSRLRPWPALLVSLVLMAAAGAAVTGHYPLAHRLALYLLPALIVLLTVPLDLAARYHRREPGGLRRPTAVAVAVVATVVVLLITTGPALLTGIGKLGHPDDVTSGRQALAFVASRREPSDVVLADRWASRTFEFYGPRENVRADGLVAMDEPANGRCDPDPLARLGGASRVWLVLAHHFSGDPANRNETYESQFAARATVLASYRGAGDAAAYLFDLSKPPRSPSPPFPSWVGHGCFTVRLGSV
jgi:hypothetical protein